MLIATYRSRVMADLAASLLKAEGIDTLVLSDDAGGAYPMLQFLRGVRLLVEAGDEDRAREILAAASTGQLAAEEIEE